MECHVKENSPAGTALIPSKVHSPDFRTENETLLLMVSPLVLLGMACLLSAVMQVNKGWKKDF